MDNKQNFWFNLTKTYIYNSHVILYNCGDFATPMKPSHILGIPSASQHSLKMESLNRTKYLLPTLPNSSFSLPTSKGISRTYCYLLFLLFIKKKKSFNFRIVWDLCKNCNNGTVSIYFMFPYY